MATGEFTQHNTTINNLALDYEGICTMVKADFGLWHKRLSHVCQQKFNQLKSAVADPSVFESIIPNNDHVSCVFKVSRPGFHLTRAKIKVVLLGLCK